MVRVGDAVGAAAAALALNVTKFIPYQPRNGVPALNVLYTSDEDQAWYFIRNRLNSTAIGLDMQWKPTTQEKPFSRSSILQLAVENWVLLFDVLPTPWYGLPPQPLSERFCEFLQEENRTFYGMILANDAARLAFELDCVISNGVDLRKTPWDGSSTQGGLVAVGNRILGTTLSKKTSVAMSNWEWRELTASQLRFMTEKAYLSWAVADHFLKSEGTPGKHAELTKTDIYAAGRPFRKARKNMQSKRFDWSEVRARYIQEKRSRRAEKLKAEGGGADDAAAAERKEKKLARRKARAIAEAAAEGQSVAAPDAAEADAKRRELREKSKQSRRAAKMAKELAVDAAQGRSSAKAERRAAAAAASDAGPAEGAAAADAEKAEPEVSAA